MGTHGYVVFKYKGIYYCYYNHSDSYCAHLGELVVNEIYKMIDDNCMDFYKNKLLRLPFNDDHCEGLKYFYTIYDAIINYESSNYYTSEEEISSEYVYIIDFDEDEFIINKYGDRYIFDLLDIPNDWMEIVEENEYYEYENKEEKRNNMIKNKILELEKEINKLKLQLN